MKEKMNLMKKTGLILLCIIIPNTAFGMRINIVDNFNKVISLEFKVNYHTHSNEILEVIHHTIDLIKLIIDKI